MAHVFEGCWQYDCSPDASPAAGPRRCNLLSEVCNSLRSTDRNAFSINVSYVSTLSIHRIDRGIRNTGG